MGSGMLGSGKDQRSTVLDVAREAGVSVATVSRVLSNVPTVSEKNRQLVMDTVARMGFRPNFMARNLRRGRGTTVALIVSDIEQHFFASAAKQIQQSLEQDGLDLLLYDTNHKADRMASFLARAPSMGLCGIVIATTDNLPLDTIRPMIAEIKASGIQVITIIQQFSGLDIPAIVHEERDACIRSVRYLLRTNRTPVAFVGRISGSVVGYERYEGYRAALQEAGEPIRKELIFDAEFRYAGGYDAISAAISRGLEFRSLQASSDELAYGAIAALRDRGKRVPEDVAVIGFSNLDMSAHMRPGLTSVSSNYTLLSQRVAAFFRGDGLETDVNQSPIRRDLVIRDSA
jgi:DNA-binding LacI/PurR family transcriptional regulator